MAVNWFFHIAPSLPFSQVITLKICAVIPAYNEEDNIAEVVKKTMEYVDSVIVVDDGSEDDTAHIAEMMGAKVVRHGVNKGYGSAIKSCFDVARRFDADITVILDGDGQHRPEHIPKLIDAMHKKDLDIVIGSRFSKMQNDIPTYRRFGIAVLNQITAMFSKGKFDSQSGFRAYSKKAIKLINPVESGMGVSSEILIKAREHDLKVGEIPITVDYEDARPSQHPVSHGLSVIVSIIRLVGQRHPLIFFGFSGLIFFSGGMVLGWWVLNRYDEVHILPVGIALITVILVILGVFLMTMGMTMWVIQDTIRRSIAEHEGHREVVESAVRGVEMKK